MDFLAGSKNAKLGSRIVPNTEVLLCRFKAHNLSIVRFSEGSMIALSHKVLKGFRQDS